MRPDLFTSSAPGKVLHIGHGETAYHAFIPAPLPPELPFDAQTVSALSNADRALGELAGLGRTIANPRLLISPFMRQEAVLSSRIEGTETGLTDLYEYEAGQLVVPGVGGPKAAADAQEVLNYVRALQHGLACLEKLPVSLRLIRETHSKLMEGVRGGHATPGEFRRSQNWIGPPGCQLKDASYVPPPVPEMQDALNALERYLHVENGLPPLLRLACIHYQFEAIHPFLDGNGRIGRLLIPLLMVSWGLLPHPLLYLSVFFERRREDYYRLLLKVSTTGAWGEWTGFFLRGVEVQARDAVTRAKRLQDLQATWREALHRTRASALAIRLADALFESPMLTIPKAGEILGVSYQGAARLITKLEKVGILSLTEPKARGKIFVAADILKIIGEEEPGGLIEQKASFVQ